MITLEQAARSRAEAALRRADRPSQRRGLADDRVECRGRVVVARARGEVGVVYGERGASFSRYASVTDAPYEMWDSFGPYREQVRNSAFEATLGAAPLVEFSTNHGSSLPMAHTRNGTLDLGLDSTGLHYTPTVDPTRTDVGDMLKAIERGDLVESSFKFRIDAGTWNEDFTEFTIEQVDLNRGDVSIVNFGANPFTADFAPRSASRAAMGESVHPLAPRQAAMYQAGEALVEVFGKFDQSSGPDGSHYMPVSPFAGEGLACANCAFFEGPRGCELVDGDISPEALCKLWVIPADLLGATAGARSAVDAGRAARLRALIDVHLAS